MITKEELLGNVSSYSPEQIAEAIKAGVVSIYELSTQTGGAFTPSLYNQVETALKTLESSGNVETPVSPAPLQNGEKKSMFANPFSFKGRIRRTEMWCTYLIYIIYMLVISSFINSWITRIGDSAAIFIFVFLPPIYWFMLAQNAKRCHDRGNSGWYQFIPLYTLFMLFGDSESGNNKYGSCPK